MREKILGKLLLCLLLVLLAVFSSLVVSDWATSLERNQAVYSSISDKAETVLKLTAASTVASAGISAIPGDTATPIAGKLADFTEYFLLILCVLYAEKYLIGVIGAAAFQVMIPVACLLWIVSLFWNAEAMRRLARRLALLAVVFSIVIPVSIGVSDLVYENYKSSIDATMQESSRLSADTSGLSEAGDNSSLVSSVLGRLSETVTGLADRAAKLLNRYVEALAILIVTSCIIPLLALVFFIWLFRLLVGSDAFAALTASSRDFRFWKKSDAEEPPVE